MQPHDLSLKHLVIFLPFLLSFFSYGQKYSLGVKVAPSVSWPGFGDKDDKKIFSRRISVGYSAGLVLSFPLKQNFDLFIEGGVSQKKRKLEFTDGETWTNISTYHFVDGNLLLRKSYKFNLEKNVPSLFFFNIGPDIAYWLNGNGQLYVDGPAYHYNIVFNQPPDGNFHNMYINDVNRWLFGLTVGVGVKAPLSKGQHITTELRFVSGHTFLGNRNSSFINILGFQDTMMTNLKCLSLNISYTFDFDVQQARKGKSTLDKKIKRRR
jgi:hypothetical protein